MNTKTLPRLTPLFHRRAIRARHHECIISFTSDGDGLRLLRSMIEASGDRAAIRDYNEAVTGLKRSIALSDKLPVESANRSSVCDRENESGSFEKACRQRHRKPVGHSEASSTTERSAEDQQDQSDSYTDVIERARRKMLSK